jgi:hypothetical protein
MKISSGAYWFALLLLFMRGMPVFIFCFFFSVIHTIIQLKFTGVTKTLFVDDVMKIVDKIIFFYA